MKEERSISVKRKIRNILEIICIFVFVAGAAFLLVNVILDYKSKRNMNELREKIKAARIQAEVLPRAEAYEPEISAGESVTVESTEESKETKSSAKEMQKTPVFEAYRQIHEENENFYGWLAVEDTDIDYPVMQGPDNEFYLSHDMDRRYDKYGMLLMDYNCSEEKEVPHYIIYGHNVSNGKYFGELMFYGEKAYYDYHPTVIFDSLYENREFEVFAALNTSVIEAGKQHLFTSYGFSDEKSYNELVSWAKEKSIYDTGVTPEYGAEILTLVTCEYSQDEGRFIVMASRKKEENDN